MTRRIGPLPFLAALLGAALLARPAGGAPEEGSTARPSGGGVVEGVVLRDGRPIAALVEVLEGAEFRPPARWPEHAEDFLDAAPARRSLGVVAAGPDGRFRFEGTGTRDVVVVAKAPDGSSGSVTFPLLRRGERHLVRVEVAERSASLRGHVVHADGVPWKGTVEALRLGARVPVAEDGAFALAGLPRGRLSLFARAGDLVVTFPARAGEDAPQRFVVPASLVPLALRVVAAEDGAPIAGATALSWGSDGGAFSVARATSDATGSFLPARYPSKGEVHLRAPGRATTFFHGSSLPAEVRLARDAVLAGRVVRLPEETPVAGAFVAVVGDPPDADGRHLAAVRTDADGRFRIHGLPERHVRVGVEAPGLRLARASGGPRSVEERVLVPLVAGSTVDLPVRLERGAVVRGRVLDADGRPSPGAVVEAAPSDARGRSPGYDPERLYERGTATDAQGRFEVAHLAPGVPYRCVARAPDRVDAPWSEAVVGRAEPRDGEAAPGAPPYVVLRFPPSRRVVVRVADVETDAPLPGIVVSAPGTAAASTGPGGTAVFEALPLADVVLQVSSAEGYVVPATITLPPPTREATLHLVRGLAIAGRVVASPPAPLTAGVATATRIDRLPSARRGGPPSAERPDLPVASAEVSSDGRFVLDGLPPGRYRVAVQGWSGSTAFEGASDAVAGAVGVEVSLTARTAPALSPVARVLDPDGRPVPSARGRSRVGDRVHATTVHAGTATVAAAREEDALLEFWGATAADGTPLPLGVARVRVPAGVAKGVEVRLPPESRASGRVVREDGGPVDGLRVHASFAEDVEDARSRYRPDLHVSSAATDADGRFGLGGLGPEGLVLWVEPPPEFLASDTVAFTGDDPAPTFVLRRAVHVDVTVVDSGGEPVAEAQLTARLRDGRRTPVAHARTDVDGRARVGPLDPRSDLALDVSARVGGEPTRASFDPWRPSEVTRLVLPRSVPLAGRVTQADGTPAVRATVRIVTPRLDGSSTTRTDSGGRFRFDRVPEGAVRVEAWASHPIGASEVQEVATRGVGLSIGLPAVGDLVVHVRGTPAGARARIARRTSDGRDLAAESPANDAGEFRFDGVPQDAEVSFLSSPAFGGSSPPAWLDGLRAGMVVSVLPQAGGSVGGRVTAAPDARIESVVVRRGAHAVVARVGAGGAWRVDGLPVGEWTAEATLVEPGGASRTLVAPTRTGEDVVLDGLSPAPERPR